MRSSIRSPERQIQRHETDAERNTRALRQFAYDPRGSGYNACGQAVAVLLELLEGPPHGGPSNVLGPGGRIRTGIRPLDRPLYQLSYPGVVPQRFAQRARDHKMSRVDLSDDQARRT